MGCGAWGGGIRGEVKMGGGRRSLSSWGAGREDRVSAAGGERRSPCYSPGVLVMAPVQSGLEPGAGRWVSGEPPCHAGLLLGDPSHVSVKVQGLSGLQMHQPGALPLPLPWALGGLKQQDGGHARAWPFMLFPGHKPRLRCAWWGQAVGPGPLVTLAAGRGRGGAGSP